MDELVLDGVLDRVFLDKLWIELLEDLELVLEFTAASLLGLFGLGFLFRFSRDVALAGTVLLDGVDISAAL